MTKQKKMMKKKKRTHQKTPIATKTLHLPTNLTSNSDIRKQSYAKNRFSTVHFSPPSCNSPTIARKFNDTHLSSFPHDFHAPSLTDPYTCHACTNSETCSFCIDEFLNIDIYVPCTSLYNCHVCTDSELCDSCIDEFLNIVVDSPVPGWIPSFDLECTIAVYALGTVFGNFSNQDCSALQSC
ncbi:hypothetical protein Lal_00046700 [Lupinus albus]|nr:hypothetical protein Lal_00046700 [Lupinus albus]